MDSAEEAKSILFSNGSEFSVPSPIDSSDLSPRSEYFFSPKFIEQYIKSPIHVLSSSPKDLNTFFPHNFSERSPILPSNFPFDDELLYKESLYDSIMSPEETRSPSATNDLETPTCITYFGEPNSPLPERTTLLTEPNCSSQEQTTLLTAQLHTADSQVKDCVIIGDRNVAGMSDAAYTPDQNDIFVKNEHNADENDLNDKTVEDTLENRVFAKTDVKDKSENNSTTVRNLVDIWVSNETIAESSTANVSPTRSEHGSDGPPAKRRKKYRPRIHVPKTLNLRGNHVRNVSQSCLQILHLKI